MFFDFDCTIDNNDEDINDNYLNNHDNDTNNNSEKK